MQELRCLGKTTLIEQAVADSYSYIPTHTTRLPRSGEVSGVHSVFLREEQFESNFREGLYIEDSLEFAYMPGIGIYYGYPREQMDLLKKNGFCSSPVSAKLQEEYFICAVAMQIGFIYNVTIKIAAASLYHKVKQLRRG